METKKYIFSLDYGNRMEENQGSGAFRGKCGGRQGRNHLGIVDLEIKYIIKKQYNFLVFDFRFLVFGF